MDCKSNTLSTEIIRLSIWDFKNTNIAILIPVKILDLGSESFTRWLVGLKSAIEHKHVRAMFQHPD